MKVQIAKDGVVQVEEKGKTHRLTNITTQFVSLVTAGANRQKKFFVVKADDDVKKIICPECGAKVEGAYGDKCSECGVVMQEPEGVTADKIIPGLVPSPRLPGPKCPNCGKKLPRPMPDKCPSCGHPLKIGDEEEDSTGDSDGKKPKKKDDGKADNAQVIDNLSAWLTEAGNRAEGMSIDKTLEDSMVRPSVPEVAAKPEDQAQQVDKRSASSDGGDESQRKEELEKARLEADDLRLKLKKEEDARKAAERREKRLLKSAVGGTTSIVTGSVDLAALAAEGSAERVELSKTERKAWGSGGDLSKSAHKEATDK